MTALQTLGLLSSASWGSHLNWLSLHWCALSRFICAISCGISVDQWKSVLWSDETKLFVRCSKGERMISTCAVPLWSMEQVVWWCGGASLVTLLGIYSKLKAHWTSLATTAMSCQPIRFAFSWWRTTDNEPKPASSPCKGFLTKKESDRVQRRMTCPPESPRLNSIYNVNSHENKHAWKTRCVHIRLALYFFRQRISLCF